MLNKNIIKIRNIADNEVPKGFYEWFIILERQKNFVFYEIEDILSEGDFYSAKEYYKEATKHNKSKVWH